MSAGLLIVSQGDGVHQTFTVPGGGGIVADINGRAFRFELHDPAPAPLPSEFDVREMSTEAIVAFLLERIRNNAPANGGWGDE